MKDHSPEQPITPEEQRAKVSAMEANLAVEGLHLHPEDKALLMQSIDEGWSQEETMRRVMAQLKSNGIIPEAPAAAAE